MRHSSVLVFAVIILTSLFSTPVAAAVDTETHGTPPMAQVESDTVTITKTLELTPENPGSIQVTASVDTVRKLDGFGLFINDSAEQVTADGFTRTTEEVPRGKKKYEWDGNTQHPSITYNLDANTTRSDGGYQFVDAGEWALVGIKWSGISWAGSDEIEFVRNTEVDGPGVAKHTMAFLGEYETRTKTIHDERFRLVIPDAADLTENPEAIFDNIAHASSQLDVGARNEEVIMIAAPTPGGIQWGVGGTAIDNIFWVKDDSQTNSSRNAWIHEYVHTRQDINTTEDFNWFIEGSASYYSGLYTLQQGKISFGQFQKYLSTSDTNSLGTGAILTNIEGEHGDPEYTRGGLVAGRADQRIRLTTNRSASLTNIFRRMNSANESISNADFIRYVGSYTNNEVASDIQTATTTRQPVTMWDKETHKQAFGEIPQELDSSTEESDGVSMLIIAFIALNAVSYSVFKIYKNIA